MPSTFAWLAVDAEQRRRMMEAVDQFRDETTVDDLGIGGIRDAFSDTLFPGTSTLNTRLRYVLFIPWLMQEAAKRGSEDDMKWKFHDLERDFISALERGTGDDEQGIIGRRAGKSLQRVPSALYGGALTQWGITEPGLSAGDYFRRIETKRQLAANAPRAEDEGTGPEYIPDGLDPSLPDAPPNLVKAADFALTPAEVDYLKETITRNNPGTLLARLAHRRPSGWTTADGTPDAPWDRPVLDLLDPVADQELTATLDLAERFSFYVLGANLLYNLLLAEATSGDTDRFRDDRVEHYRERLQDWAAEESLHRPFDSNDLRRLGQLMSARRRNFTHKTQTFLAAWFDEARSPLAIADAYSARDLIARRERSVKGSRARLRPGNVKALNAWSGASGSARLYFRWGNVTTLLQDLYDGDDRH